MVGGGIEYHCVGVGEHHSGYHAADFLASGKNRSLFEHLLAAEKHLAEKSLKVYFRRDAKKKKVGGTIYNASFEYGRNSN